ncbi:hypothetical protein GE061_014056 [Apolygus lucorum]|uniref:Uncharacterized protein n=1 Tax=Apolygus lucorum TaxID=248454 RepID=A0A8S9XPR9_APOLU|nr:hypothetical protein GE061_014056 [Apolygus lucorum]
MFGKIEPSDCLSNWLPLSKPSYLRRRPSGTVNYDGRALAEYDQRFNTYRNSYADPYRQFYERRPPQPPRHPQIALPPQPITIVRKPLDVRPLDPDSDYTTQGPPHVSSTNSPSTHSPSASSTSTTSSPQLSSYERTFDGRKF